MYHFWSTDNNRFSRRFNDSDRCRKPPISLQRKQTKCKPLTFYRLAPCLSRTDFCPTFFTVWPMSFRIVETLILLGEKLGCYKISLECKDPLLSYYTQFGFKLEEGQNYLCKRFYHWELNASWVVPEKKSLPPLCLYQMSFFNQLEVHLDFQSLILLWWDFLAHHPLVVCGLFSVITQSFKNILIICRLYSNLYLRT